MMNLPKDRIDLLWQKFVDDAITLAERRELMQWISEHQNEEQVKDLIGNLFEKIDSGLVKIDQRLSEEEKDQLYQGMHITKETPVVSMKERKRIWIPAAAIIISVLGAALFFYRSQPAKGPATAQEEHFKNDIVPAREGVKLTLTDGSVKILDTMANGTITEGATKALKEEGSISYLANRSAEVAYNTVATEKGRIFHLVLADGTNVWLDALSSIRFPTAFPGAERVVEVTGEAYFEVTKNPKQPFKVKTGNQEVEVLGTHFNINSYDQQSMQTTLLEGSVKVTLRQAQGDKSLKIKPGEQSIARDNASLTIDHSPDLEEVMAWKDGKFDFEGASVQEIMNQLSRWYDIDVVYKDKIDKEFVAKISRDLPVSKILTLLEMTRQIKFTIEGNRVTVMKW